MVKKPEVTPGFFGAFPVVPGDAVGTRCTRHRMQGNPTNNPQALQIIYQAGGHFVLCLENKRPVWQSWQKLRPGLDVVLAHEGLLGLKPFSISTSVLDVDSGDPGKLIQACPPMAILDSRRAGGKHLYYSDTAGRGNGYFEVYGCAGDIRSAKGYLILWYDGVGRLAATIDDPIARARSFPCDLFELAGLPAVTLPGVVKTPAYSYKPSDQSRQAWAIAAAAVPLETIKRGWRNLNLFDAVRFCAYSVSRGTDYDAWTRRVLVFALKQNRRFPEPLHESEVKQTAYSISTWCWSGGGARWHFDHSSAAQRRRGLKLGRMRSARNAERDAAIVAAVRAGQSMRSVARQYGLSAMTVSKIVGRVNTKPNQLAANGWLFGQGVNRA